VISLEELMIKYAIQYRIDSDRGGTFKKFKGICYSQVIMNLIQILLIALQVTTIQCQYCE